MVCQETEVLYKNYQKLDYSHWNFGNQILYKMCADNPLHNQEDIIIGKIWLIGRSYAAAIDRRKNALKKGDAFYYEVVAPEMIKNGPELDDRLGKIRRSKASIRETATDILRTHKFLTDIFFGLTGLKMRSLVSKYLHFHCPEKFFIYDSIAEKQLKKIVVKPWGNILVGIDNYDEQYGNYLCRMLELQTFIEDNFNVYEMPRRLDNFLLFEI